MVLYLSIMFISMFLIALLNSLFMRTQLALNTFQIIGFVVLAVVLSIVIDAICALVVRILPKKCRDYKTKFFLERKNERNFLNKLNVRKWKDKIPEFGKIFKVFDKTKISDKPTPEYMEKFLQETCVAELMHFISVFTAPLLLVMLPFKMLLTISLPVVLVNIFLQILPIIVQRYTRPKLVIAYTRLLRQNNKKEEEIGEKQEDLEKQNNKKEKEEDK